MAKAQKLMGVQQIMFSPDETKALFFFFFLLPSSFGYTVK
jgi:hypothetical protein